MGQAARQVVHLPVPEPVWRVRFRPTRLAVGCRLRFVPLEDDAEGEPIEYRVTGIRNPGRHRYSRRRGDAVNHWLGSFVELRDEGGAVERVQAAHVANYSGWELAE